MEPLLESAVQIIINPIIQVAFAVATIVFVYGVFEFIRGADNPEVRKQGQQHILWGLIGLAIMVSVFTIIDILLNTLGAKTPPILKK
jgi:Type IV secretion system pilin